MNQRPARRRPLHTHTPCLCALVLAAMLRPVMIMGQIQRIGPVGTAISPESQATNSSATRSVSGTVVNAINGAPVGHALVQIQSQAQRETSPGSVTSYPVQHATFTDESGQFLIAWTDAAPSLRVFDTSVASVHVFKPGYFSTDERPGSKPLVKIGEENGAPVNVSLMPESVITGHVLDENGEPVMQAMVTARCARVMDGHKQWQDCATAATDEDGAFRVTHLMPGSYYLRARVFAMMRRIEEGPGGHEGHMPAYYPVERDGTSHGTFELRAGARVDATLKMREGRVFNVYGMVSGTVAQQGLAMTLVTASGEVIPTDMQLEAQSGTFVIKNVPPGTYRVRATSNDPAGQPLTAETPVTVGNKDIVNVDLSLRPAMTIPVVVHTEFTRDPAEAMVSGPAVLHGGRVNAMPPPVYGCLRGIDHPEVTACITTEMKDGVPSLEIRNVVPGKYTVEMQPQGVAYVSAASYEGTDVLTEPLMVARDAPPGALEVTLRDDSGILTVSLNSSDDNSATVLIVPEKGRVVSMMIGGRGESGIPNIPPGEYKVYAFDGAEGLEFRNADVLAEYATRAAAVTLGPNEKRSVKLDVIHRSEP